VTDHLVGNAYLLAALVLAGWAGVSLARSRAADPGDVAGSGDGGGRRRAGDHHGLAGAVVAAGQEGVQLVAAAQARQTVREPGRVAGLDGVPHGRASFVMSLMSRMSSGGAV
jgi:hypothetical protein